MVSPTIEKYVDSPLPRSQNRLNKGSKGMSLTFITSCWFLKERKCEDQRICKLYIIGTTCGLLSKLDRTNATFFHGSDFCSIKPYSSRMILTIPDSSVHFQGLYLGRSHDSRWCSHGVCENFCNQETRQEPPSVNSIKRSLTKSHSYLSQGLFIFPYDSGHSEARIALPSSSEDEAKFQFLPTGC